MCEQAGTAALAKRVVDPSAPVMHIGNGDSHEERKTYEKNLVETGQSTGDPDALHQPID